MTSKNTAQIMYEKAVKLPTNAPAIINSANVRLGVKQQFCTFHLKQLINREIRDYIKENNASKRRNRNNTQL